MILFRTLSISPLLTVLTLRPLPLLVLKSLFLSSALFLILKTVLLWHPKVVWILATEHLALSIPRIWFRRDSASGGAIAAPTVTQFLVRERVLVGDVVHHDSDGFGPGPSPKARRHEAVFRGPARPEPDFLKYYSIENFGLGPKARRPEAIFLSPARPEPDFFQPDPSLHHDGGRPAGAALSFWSTKL